MRQIRHPSQAQGFTLVELMIAMALGLLLAAGVISLFINTKGAQKTQEMLAEVQETGRAAMEILNYDLRMAGALGRTYSLSPVVVTTDTEVQPNVSNNCFGTDTQAFEWATALADTPSGEKAPAVFGLDNVASGETNLFSTCVDGSQLQSGSDIVSVHYLSATPLAESELKEQRLYAHSGVGGAVIFQCPAGKNGSECTTLLNDKRTDPSGTAYYEVVSHIYFIRPWSVEQGDGIPTLVRARISGGAITTEPLIEGITNLQATYGIDNDDDGYIDQFKTASQMPALNSAAGLASDWSKIKLVKIDLIAESLTKDYRNGSGTTDVALAGNNVSVAKSKLARVFSFTVTVRNPRVQGG